MHQSPSLALVLPVDIDQFARFKRPSDHTSLVGDGSGEFLSLAPIVCSTGSHPHHMATSEGLVGGDAVEGAQVLLLKHRTL